MPIGRPKPPELRNLTRQSNPVGFRQLNRPAAKNDPSDRIIQNAFGGAARYSISSTRLTHPSWIGRPSRITQAARIMTKMVNWEVG